MKTILGKMKLMKMCHVLVVGCNYMYFTYFRVKNYACVTLGKKNVIPLIGWVK